MKLKVEYQYSSWEGRDETGGRWWIEMEEVFKTVESRVDFIEQMNRKYKYIKFREKKDCKQILTQQNTMDKPIVTIYTDGSSSHKDKIGGIGIYIKFGEHEKIISKGYTNTTNNRMELRAVIEAMKSITNKVDYQVHIYSDSELVVNTFTSWIFRWEKDNYLDRKNVDLLKEGIEEFRKFSQGNVIFHWVKGHNGIEGNEIADILASEGRLSGEYIKCQDDE